MHQTLIKSQWDISWEFFYCIDEKGPTLRDLLGLQQHH